MESKNLFLFRYIIHFLKAPFIACNTIQYTTVNFSVEFHNGLTSKQTLQTLPRQKQMKIHYFIVKKRVENFILFFLINLSALLPSISLVDGDPAFHRVGGIMKLLLKLKFLDLPQGGKNFSRRLLLK